jgi:nitrate reductase NapD
MNISGILVLTAPARAAAVADRLRVLAGVDVHHVEPDTGRIVITQEADSVAAEVDGLRRIRAVPDVVLAEMAYHWFEEDGRPVDDIPPELDAEALDSAGIPAFLKE